MPWGIAGNEHTSIRKVNKSRDGAAYGHSPL
nr:MAG TPA: hypothetical protein [Caudoviricetes sp.]